MKLSVGLVAPVYVPVPPTGYGAIEWIVHWLAEGLRARGHRVTLACSGDSTSRVDERIETYPQAPTDRMADVLPELLHASQVYAGGLAACDVVHDHTLAGPALASATRQPVLHTVHGPLTEDLCRYYQSLRGVGYVAISATQRAVEPQLAWQATIHNAVDVDRFPPPGQKQHYFAFLGRMHPAKGVVEAIHLARALGRPLRIAAKMRETSEMAYFESSVRPLLGGDVEYLGEVGWVDKLELLAGAAALAFPIQWEEPFGLAMTEALACGTPVLALRRGAVPEVVRDGVTGFVADDLPGLVRAAQGGLDRLDPLACRADVAQRFSVERLVDDHERLYEQWLGEGALGEPRRELVVGGVGAATVSRRSARSHPKVPAAGSDGLATTQATGRPGGSAGPAARPVARR